MHGLPEFEVHLKQLLRVDPTAPVQVAARSACAALLRRPVGVERTSTVVGTQEATTVELLLALLDATDLVEVPPAELGPDKARPAGGVLMVETFVVGLAETPVQGQYPESSGDEQQLDPTKSSSPTPPPDRAALLASGTPDQLAAAVGLHLLAQVEDTHDAGDARSQALHALRALLGRLAPELKREMVPRLSAVGRTPGLSEADQAEIAMDHALSRMRSRTPARWLGPLAHATAAKAFSGRRGHDEPAPTPANLEFMQEATAEATRLLRSPDPEARMIGAIILGAVAAAGPPFDHLSAPLLSHPDDRVRAVGAARATCTQAVLLVLAQDPSAQVRTAVASRAAELPELARSELADDPDLDVRRTLARALAKARVLPRSADDPTTADAASSP